MVQIYLLRQSVLGLYRLNRRPDFRQIRIYIFQLRSLPPPGGRPVVAPVPVNVIVAPAAPIPVLLSVNVPGAFIAFSLRRLANGQSRLKRILYLTDCTLF
jgi:hypothetical protein